MRYLTWNGASDTTLKKPADGGTIWTKAWVDGMQQPSNTEQRIQNQGRGLLIHGTRDWVNYKVSTEVIQHMVKTAGLAARV